jgi:hypothetical protein
MIKKDSLEGKSQIEQAINLTKEKSWVFNKVREITILVTTVQLPNLRVLTTSKKTVVNVYLLQR